MTMLSRRTVTFGLMAALSPISRASAGYAGSRQGTAFGTIVSVAAKGRSVRQVEAALDASFAAIRAVERSMSLFDANSELSRFNRTGVLHSPSQPFLETLRQSARVWRMTAGAFDPTVQPLWDVWSAAGNGGPDPALLDLARRGIGFENLRWDASQVSAAGRGAQLTFNGIAQGYAADLVARVMRSRQIEFCFHRHR